MILAIIIPLLITIIALIGTPLFIVIALAAIINFIKTPGSGGMQNVILEFTKIADMPLLHSIPLFTFAGYLLAHSNASKRMVRLTKAALGWMPGGLPIVTILVCSVFTAFTGASGVTIVALGGLLLSALLSERYGEKYSLGLVTASGSFGLLFPPSLPIIMFGVVAGMAAQSGSGASVKIEDLFIAGLVPGIFMIIILSIHGIFASQKFKVEKSPFSFKELGLALLDTIWELLLPIILFSGILSGYLAISDAAIVTVIYIFIVEVFIKKDIKIKQIPKIMKESLVLVGAILIILTVSRAANNFLIYAQVPQKLFAFIQQFISNKWVFLILLNIFLLVVGCIMDIFSAIVIVVPLILPIAESYNISLIHLGIVFLANLQIGYITPPVGMNLFIASIRFNKPILTLYKSALIFIGLLLASLVVITYFPKLSLWFIEEPSIVGQWEHKINGEADRLYLKANGKYVRQKGKGISMLMNSYYGDYELKNNKLYIYDENNKIEEYKYEIFNNGTKLLLKDLNDENMDFTDSMENEDNEDYSWEDEDEIPWEDETNNITDNRVFYINLLPEPLKQNTGKFIAKWADNDGNSAEFFYDGTCMIDLGEIQGDFSYNILKGKKLELFTVNNTEKIIFKYKLHENILFLKSKINKNNYELDFAESENFN